MKTKLYLPEVRVDIIEFLANCSKHKGQKSFERSLQPLIDKYQLDLVPGEHVVDAILKKVYEAGRTEENNG